MEKEKDPREVELFEINTRLKTVLQLLKNGHTVQALDAEIECANEGIGDTATDVYIFHDAVAFTGSRHLQSLLKLERALETKVMFSGKTDLRKECTRLLERKIALMRELHKV